MSDQIAPNYFDLDRGDLYKNSGAICRNPQYRQSV